MKRALAVIGKCERLKKLQAMVTAGSVDTNFMSKAQQLLNSMAAAVISFLNIHLRCNAMA
jgi:hypothetical protein